MIEHDVSKSNSIHLRFLLGAMKSTTKMPQDKNTQCFVSDPVNIKDVASAYTLCGK